MCVLVFYDFPFPCPISPSICIFVILRGVSEILVSWFRLPGETEPKYWILVLRILHVHTIPLGI